MSRRSRPRVLAPSSPWAVGARSTPARPSPRWRRTEASRSTSSRWSAPAARSRQASLPFVGCSHHGGHGVRGHPAMPYWPVPEAGVKASLRSLFDAAEAGGGRSRAPGLVAARRDRQQRARRLSQVIEPFLSSRANPLSDALAREGIRRSVGGARPRLRQWPRRRRSGTPTIWRSPACAEASAWRTRGWARSTDSPHRPAALFKAAHGAVCAALLPHVMAVNLRALRARAADHPALARFHEARGTVDRPEPRRRGGGGRRHVRRSVVPYAGDSPVSVVRGWSGPTFRRWSNARRTPAACAAIPCPSPTSSCRRSPSGPS